MVEQHVQEVVDTGYFERASLVRVPDADTAETLAYRAFYRAHSPQAFEQYESTDAPRLKADHVAKFGEVVSARREVLSVVADFVARGSN
jgi:hypothetical protein